MYAAFNLPLKKYFFIVEPAHANPPLTTILKVITQNKTLERNNKLKSMFKSPSFCSFFCVYLPFLIQKQYQSCNMG